MKLYKKVLVFLFSHFLLLTLIYCYEDKESLLKRFHVSNQISKYSSNSIKLNVSQSEGISCLANDFIEKNQKLITVPKNYSLCTYFLFPFKYEILSFMLELPDLKDTIKSSQKVSFYLLSYYLLYYIYAPKEEIKSYIKDKKLAQYYNCNDIDDFLKEYFPKEIPGSGLLYKEHYELLKSLGYQVPDEDQLEKVFKYTNTKILSSEHKDIIHPWTNNLRHFKWAFTMIVSRSFTIKMQKYLKLEGLDPTNKLDSSTKKNYEVNKFISPPNVGAPCLIPFIDLLNHYQPQYTDLRDKRSYNIDAEKGNFVYYASHRYTPDQEILNTYNYDPTNILLFLNYGFVLSNNIFNSFKITVRDYTTLSYSQFQLCKELKCVDVKLNDPRQLYSGRFYEAKFSSYDESLINYGRVLHLDQHFDKNSVLRTFANKGKFSIENEIKSWIYYFKCFNNFDRKISNSVEKSIKECQKSRNIIRNIESYWINEDTKTTEYNRIKTYENIYILDVSYKKIVIRHMMGSINQVILNTNRDLESMKIKYIA
jgi:hypothetical protein